MLEYQFEATEPETVVKIQCACFFARHAGMCVQSHSGACVGLSVRGRAIMSCHMLLWLHLCSAQCGSTIYVLCGRAATG